MELKIEAIIVIRNIREVSPLIAAVCWVAANQFAIIFEF